MLVDLLKGAGSHPYLDKRLQSLVWKGGHVVEMSDVVLMLTTGGGIFDNCQGFEKESSHQQDVGVCESKCN